MWLNFPQTIDNLVFTKYSGPLTYPKGMFYSSFLLVISHTRGECRGCALFYSLLAGVILAARGREPARPRLFNGGPGGELSTYMYATVNLL